MNAPPHSIIRLPAHTHIILNGFSIFHPISIIGRPGTIIEIQNGNIVIDFRDYLDNLPPEQRDATKRDNSIAMKAMFSELSLIFKYDLGWIAELVCALSKNN
jgi:hypothetical protein